MRRTLRLVLGDQINSQHSWWQRVDQDTIYVMMEIRPESLYVTHHIQKIVGIFLAMRRFAAERTSAGHHVEYFKINDADNLHSFKLNIQSLLNKYPCDTIEYQEPDEYRLDQLLREELGSLGLKTSCVSAEHYYTSRFELSSFFEGKSTYIMENFYRYMRRKHKVLMEDDKPTGGDWNYDKSNRNKLPKDHIPPDPLLFTRDVSELYQEIVAAQLPYIGRIDAKSFSWPVDRSEALMLIDYFADHLLVHFGTYQDALSHEHWSMYHSRLSFALNIKLISPKEVIDRIEQEWILKRNESGIAISQVEGFVRQILGWREYMRGIYWAHMPSFAQMNYFEHDQRLPGYFWSGDTRMRCIAHTVGQSMDHAYAHHIQRLMVTGNFALLAGVDPDEVDRWYLGIYIDAFEWVEITNTRGMSQYADGGIVGTKPYVSSASYIHKMGDYCKGCHYDHKKKTGDGSCPFNSLYWHFLARHRESLEPNPRMTMMYRVWDKMDNKEDILNQGQYYFDHLEEL